MSQSRPWRVEVRAAGEITRWEDFRSAKQRDAHVREICDAMRAGTTLAHTITIREWDPALGRHTLWEVIERANVIALTQPTQNVTNRHEHGDRLTPS